MKYLNMPKFREELYRLENDAAIKGGLMAAGSYSRVLDMLDDPAYQFDLSNSWGRLVCYMEGQEPPTVPCTHLAAKVASLLAEPRTCPAVCDAADSAIFMAQLVLATVKTFDDYLQEKEAEYGLFGLNDDGDEDSATIVFHEIASQFHTMFGRPGFLQTLPDWIRKSFAWSYPSEEGSNDPS
ncbi:MAG: hypothetical protein ACYTFQ_20640 [Planctomycetota bacterium]|jgi:hypothetical protein